MALEGSKACLMVRRCFQQWKDRILTSPPRRAGALSPARRAAISLRFSIAPGRRADTTIPSRSTARSVRSPKPDQWQHRRASSISAPGNFAASTVPRMQRRTRSMKSSSRMASPVLSQASGALRRRPGFSRLPKGTRRLRDEVSTSSTSICCARCARPVSICAS